MITLRLDEKLSEKALRGDFSAPGLREVHEIVTLHSGRLRPGREKGVLNADFTDACKGRWSINRHAKESECMNALQNIPAVRVIRWEIG